MFESATAKPRFSARFPIKLPSFSFRGAGCLGTAAKILLVLSPLILVRGCLMTYVPPDEIGLRQIAFGSNKGLQKELVRPGYRRQIRGYETIRTFPRNIQVLEFTSSETERSGDHRSVDAVNVLPEHHRVLRLVIPALGFPSAEVGYRREARAAGRSKYPFTRMLRLSVDSVTGFSIAPLRLATWFGLLGGLVALALLAYALISFATGHTTPGWTSTFVAVAAVGAVQLLCLGLLGEYVGRMYTQLQGRPAYFVAYDSHEQGTAHGPGRRSAGDGADGQGRRQLTSSETPGSERTGR